MDACDSLYGEDSARRLRSIREDGGAYPECLAVSTSGITIRDEKEEQVRTFKIRTSALQTPEDRALGKSQLQEAINKRIVQDRGDMSSAKSNEHAQYIKYEPVGMKERVIKVQSLQRDPLHPPQFRLKKDPGESKAFAEPLTQSPPHKLHVEDREAWKIPPSVSNWKNAKGYMIPLDKRLAADGRGLVEVKINDNFAKFAEALYVAERSARMSVETRSNMQRYISMQEQASRENTIREVAARALQRDVGATNSEVKIDPTRKRKQNESDV